jgi:hypothetical protein
VFNKKYLKQNNLSLNVIKTKEMIVDDRKRRTEHTPILIDGIVVEQVESFKFLGVHITTQNNMVQAHQDNREVGTTEPIPPQETEKIWHGSSDPQKSSTAAPSRAWLHHLHYIYI